MLNDKNILEICNIINGKTLRYLIEQVNFKYHVNDKGWVGKLIEYYFHVYNNKQSYFDLPKLGIEIKTISLDLNYHPLYDVCLFASKLFTLFKFISIKKFLYFKIKKILWVPILGKIKLLFLNRIVGTAFIHLMSEYYINIIIKEIESILDEIIHFSMITDVLVKYFSRNFIKIQIFSRNNMLLKELHNINFRVFLKKFFIKKFFL